MVCHFFVVTIKQVRWRAADQRCARKFTNSKQGAYPSRVFQLFLSGRPAPAARWSVQTHDCSVVEVGPTHLAAVHFRGTGNNTGTLKISTLVDGIPEPDMEWKTATAVHLCHRRCLNWCDGGNVERPLGRAWHKDQGRPCLLQLFVDMWQCVLDRRFTHGVAAAMLRGHPATPARMRETRMKSVWSPSHQKGWAVSEQRLVESIRRAQFAEYLYAGHFRETCNSAVWKQGARCFSEVVPSSWWCLHIQAGRGGGSTMCTSSACKIDRH